MYNPTIEGILDELCLGAVKCDVMPPKILYVPALHDSKHGNIIFHSNPMSGTWCSVELKKDFEVGYVISNIHAGFTCKVIFGLMNIA